MKLLGWMHRKFRQNNSADPLKDFAIDRTFLDDQQHYGPRPGNFSKSGSRARNFRKSFATVIDAGCDDPDAEDDLFRGLLAIGTLGSDPTLSDAVPEKAEPEAPLPPEKSESVEEAPKPAGDGTGTVNSGPEPPAPNAGTVCPLQRYLLGSPVDVGATTVAKKEQRTSLGELFQREEGRQDDKDGAGEKCSVQRMKKMLKRRTSHGPSRSGGDAAAATAAAPVSDAASGETKLRKILHIFHRKVHPENSTSIRETDKPNKYTKRKKEPRSGGDDENRDRLLQDEHDIIIHPIQRPIRKEALWHCNYNLNPTAFTLAGCESNGNREYWIKTDADYLVLEL